MIISNNSKNLIVKYISILINQNYNNSCNVTDTYKNSIYNDFKIDSDCICSNLIGYNYNNDRTSADALKYCKIDYVGGVVTNIIYDENDITEADYMQGILSTKQFGTNSILRKKRLFYEVEVTNTCYGRKMKEEYANYLKNPYLPTTLTEDEIKDLNDNFIYTAVFPNISGSELSPEEEAYIKKFNDEFAKYNTSSFLIKEINDNDRFFEDDYSVVLEPGDTIYCRKSTMKTIDSLCANIAMYLNSRYPTLINRSFSVDNHTVDNPEVLTEVINSDICRYFCGTDTTFNADKKSFDIDDFVASFILGRTITPYSSMEDIDYVQRLLEKNLYVDYNVNIRGEWDETLTNTLYDYQKSIKSRYKDRKKEKEGIDYNIVIPTGYFDIITEKYMLQDMQLFGEDFNNAYSSI